MNQAKNERLKELALYEFNQLLEDDVHFQKHWEGGFEEWFLDVFLSDDLWTENIKEELRYNDDDIESALTHYRG